MKPTLEGSACHMIQRKGHSDTIETYMLNNSTTSLHALNVEL